MPPTCNWFFNAASVACVVGSGLLVAALGDRLMEWRKDGRMIAAAILMLAVAPVFGLLVSRFPRRRFVPWVYWFFIACILLFFVLLKLDVARVYVAGCFFVWVSIFNLFVVTVFWGFMSDLFDLEQGKRLFGFIAAGGTAGETNV